MITKHFNKNPIMPAEEEEEEEEEKFQLTSSGWICEKLFDVEDEKIRSLSCDRKI